VKIAIFSDLHLTTGDSRRNQVFTALLDRLLASDVNELWLLGDIFDLFIGPYEFWRETHRRLFEQLTAFTRRGGKVLWIEGNHDFHFAEALRDTGVEVADGEFFRKVDGRRVWLGHGDLVNQDDQTYLRWRAFTRSFGFRFLSRLVPEPIAEKFLVPLGEYLSRKSRAHDRYDPSLAEMYKDYARKLFRQGYEGVCLGHCHIRELLVEDGHFYLNIGTWLDGEFLYGYWDTTQSPHPILEQATGGSPRL